MMAENSLAAFPSEEIEAITINAEQRADLVADFLDLLGLKPDASGAACYLPREFLLDLGWALWLYRWEANCIRAHKDAGLPGASDALLYAYRQILPKGATANLAVPSNLGCQLLALFVERFSWAATIEWGADVVIDFPDEDKALDALAAFLWQNRHARP